MSTTAKILLALLLLMTATGCARPTERAPSDPNHEEPASENAAQIRPSTNPSDATLMTLDLHPPRTKGNKSVEEALSTRRSRRDFEDRALPAEALTQILWSAYGITKPLEGTPSLRGGLRTAPSAGALYPLEIYAVVGAVDGLAPGIYKYVSHGHKLALKGRGDRRSELAAAARGQDFLAEAPAVLVFAAVFDRTTPRYGDRGRERYVWMEAGHAAQNVYLQAEALNLGTCAVGAFNDDAVRQVIGLPPDEDPLYILPIGYPLPE